VLLEDTATSSNNVGPLHESCGTKGPKAQDKAAAVSDQCCQEVESLRVPQAGQENGNTILSRCRLLGGKLNNAFLS
jgi:hypothetical protein